MEVQGAVVAVVPMAIPGKYTVEVHQQVDGKVTELIAATPFEIEPITFGDTTEINRSAILEFAKKALKLRRKFPSRGRSLRKQSRI